ncbi:multiple coagulation factor deficiency protein 2 homolog [Paramacrobiotus metropolitanus]|uniref:multiple coagulation factor deficiency protein 2 homolog n=1 Tax=Paramacrobiotus metropolitanus TaxID=2943436 RepID=UPI0024463671|nr:multiple coagulation factor deficiency protein 2 homolog [Paramacrobiotus metropolitanus]
MLTPILLSICFLPVFIAGSSGPLGGSPAGKPALTEDEAHIKEHLKDWADVDTSKMSPVELEFHYFKLHDSDGNGKLDGLEMLQALLHSGNEDPHHERLEPSEPIDLKVYTDIIDQVLKDDDLDQDGYLSYEEYTHRIKSS